MKIVTIFDDKGTNRVLFEKAEAIDFSTAEGLADAADVAEKLKETFLSLMPAAGLAATQIGVGKQAFVYSWNRSPEALEIVINPKILEQSESKKSSWEVCFSTMDESGLVKAANVLRPEEILVEYNDVFGNLIRKRLKAFTARVFQHEFDHLQGIVITEPKENEIKTFASKEEMTVFMKSVREKEKMEFLEPVSIH